MILIAVDDVADQRRFKSFVAWVFRNRRCCRAFKAKRVEDLWDKGQYVDFHLWLSTRSRASALAGLGLSSSD